MRAGLTVASSRPAGRRLMLDVKSYQGGDVMFLDFNNIGRIRKIYPLSKSVIGLCSICLRAAIIDRMGTKFWVKWQ